MQAPRARNSRPWRTVSTFTAQKGIGETPSTRQIGDSKSVTSFSLVTATPKMADGKRVINAYTGYGETHDK